MIFIKTNKIYDFLFWCAQLGYSVFIGLQTLNIFGYEKNGKDLITKPSQKFVILTTFTLIIVIYAVLFTVRAVKLKKEEARLIDEYINKNPNN